MVQECNDLFLTKTSMIPDSALTASSSYDTAHGPDGSRLDSVPSSVHVGAWSAATLDTNQWIQVDLQKTSLLKGVVIQGRHNTYNQWVTEFKVLHSADCQNWTTVAGTNGTEVVFQGNTDTNTHVTNTFECPVRARCIRLNPTGWNIHISLRFDVIGCYIDWFTLSLFIVLLLNRPHRVQKRQKRGQQNNIIQTGVLFTNKTIRILHLVPGKTIQRNVSKRSFGHTWRANVQVRMHIHAARQECFIFHCMDSFYPIDFSCDQWTAVLNVHHYQGWVPYVKMPLYWEPL